MDKIKFLDIVKIILLKPKTELDIVLNQQKYRYLLFFPILFGIINGINKTIILVDFYDLPHLFNIFIFNIFLTTLVVLLICFIYSWLIYLISYSLKGLANINMTYGIVSYSFIPMIVYVIIYLIINLLIDIDTNSNLSFIIYYSQFVFDIWSLIIITMGNAVINSFSMIKSFIATFGIILIVIMLLIFGK